MGKIRIKNNKIPNRKNLQDFLPCTLEAHLRTQEWMGKLRIVQLKIRVKTAMKAVRQFALVLAALLTLAQPAMVCALPNARLSSAGHACCQPMKGQCGSMEMSGIRGCCQMQAPASTNWAEALPPKAASIPVELAAPSSLHPALYPLLMSAQPAHAQQPGSSLPQSPPSAISVLRI